MSHTPDLSNIQANILHGSSLWTHARYMFFRVEHRIEAGRFLESLTTEMHNAERRVGAPRAGNINVAISFDGLGKLGVSMIDDRFERGFLPSDELPQTVAMEATPPEVPDGESPSSEDYVDGGSVSQTSTEMGAFESGMVGRAKQLMDRWPQRQGETPPPTTTPDDQSGYVWSDNAEATQWWSDAGKPWDPDQANWPHILVWVSAVDVSELDRLTEFVRKTPQGVTEIGTQDAHGLPEAKEHYGFVDGISQPAIKGIRRGNPGDGKLGATGWEGLEVGEFILGYRDEGFQTLRPPRPCEVTMDGTFLVYRKLYQDVAAYCSAVATMATRSQSSISDKSSHSKADIGARIMGRNRDGTPLLVRPGAPDAQNANANKDEMNDFRYEHDPDGFGCPLGSHVRRSNPRDDLHFEGRLVNRHRIIRRGMPYGELYTEETADADRGLIFIALNARLEDQFEFVQKEWLNMGRVFRTGSDADPIAGNPGDPNPHQDVGFTDDVDIRIVVNGEEPVLHEIKHPFTRFRGGGYFFVPSFPGLAAIVRSSAGEILTDECDHNL